MIGGGLQTNSVDRRAKELGVMDRFTFTGYRSDAAALVKACDISISASLFGEATQKAVIEAMHLGNPMIITDIPGNRGMVEDGVSGYVIPSADAEALAAALLKLYNSQELRETMGIQARKHITAFLSIERSVSEYDAFYKRIASE
jgi:glycosyltransferase involved in cell wall biosynthesis